MDQNIFKDLFENDENLFVDIPDSLSQLMSWGATYLLNTQVVTHIFKAVFDFEEDPQKIILRNSSEMWNWIAGHFVNPESNEEKVS